MSALLEASIWQFDRPASAPASLPNAVPATGPMLDPARWVPAEVHCTPPEVMKRDLPQRIHALVERHGSPLLVIDRAKLVQEYEHFRRLLPRVRLYYAVKANPHPDVIKTFAGLGGCFDVASEGEMRHVLAQGVEPERLIFANTIKRPEALAFARDAGVDFVTFDSEPELYKLAKHAPGCRVLARLRVGNAGSQVDLSLKFGADAEVIVPLLCKARALGLRAEGISFHVGSQCGDYDNYQRAFEQAAGLLAEARQRGLHLSTLDIGGGFPIRQCSDERTTVQNFGTRMRHDLDRLFPSSVDLIAEPGRALVGPAGLLITRVVGRSIRNNLNYYYLDDGVYGDFSGIVFDHSRYDFRALKRTPKFLSVLAGPTCDSFDTVARGVELPELDVGDIVYVPNIGAYSCASAVTFNGIPPAKVMVI
jgi:ornithine decarboxylase